MDNIDNKVSKISDVTKDKLCDMLDKININNITPKSENGISKRIYDCTGRELMDILFKNKDIVNLCNELCVVYGNQNNMLADLFINLRLKNNKDVMKANLLSLTIITLLYKNIYTQLFEDKKDSINIDTLQEKLIIEQIMDKEEYCKKYKKEDLPLSQKRYYDGQQEMLNKIKDIIL